MGCMNMEKRIIEMLTRKGFEEGFGCYYKDLESENNLYRCFYCYEENLIAIEKIIDVWNYDKNELLYKSEVDSVSEIEKIISKF